MNSSENIDNYIQLANQLYEQQNELLLKSFKLPKQPIMVIRQLLEKSAELLYQHPGRAWAIVLVGETIAERGGLPWWRARSALMRAWASHLWVNMEQAVDAAEVAFNCFSEMGDTAWANVAVWQKYAQPWMVNAQEALSVLKPLKDHWPTDQPDNYHFFPHYLISLAWAYLQTGQPEPALDTIDTAAQYFKRSEDLVGLACCQFVRGAAWRNRGQARESIAYYEQALILINEIQAPAYGIRIHCGYAYALRIGRSDFKGAADNFEQAIQTAKMINVPHWKMQAQIGLSEIYQLQGRLQEAISIVRNVRDNKAKRSTAALITESLIDSSAYHNEMGQFQAALGYAQEGLLLQEQHPTYVGQRIVLLTNLGIALWYLGRYQQALQQLEAAQELAASTQFAVRIAEVAVYLAYVWHELGQLERAEQIYQEIRTIAQDNDDISLRYDLAVLEAGLHFAQSTTEQLVDSLQSHIDYMIAKESRLYESRLKQLQAALLVQGGHYEQALSLLQASLQDFQEMGMIGAEAKTYLLLGNVFERLNQPDLAREAWQKTLLLSTKQPQNRWQAQARLAQLAQKQNKPAVEILAHYQEALAALSMIRQATWQTALLSDYLTDAQQVIHEAVLFASTHFPEQTLALIEMSKAHALAVQIRLEPLTETFGLSAGAREVRQKLADLEREIARPDMSMLQRLRKQRDWAQLAQEYDRLQAVYERSRQATQFDISEWEHFQLPVVREQAGRYWDSDWVAVDYHLSENTLIVVVITADELWLEQRDASQLPVLLEFLSDPTHLRAEYLQRLADILLPDSIHNRLSPQTVLLIAPHAKLHRIPWAALTAKAGRPLVMDCQPLIVPSLQLFTVLDGERLVVRNGLLTAVTEFPNRSYPSLPLTHTEAAALQDMTAISWHLHLDEEATWAELQTFHEQPSWVELHCWHIATHAFFREQGNARACGLSLYDQDIWLDEVAQLAPLPPLVTLSACLGLPGKVFSGDDHAGLAATCLTAGCKNVVGSLWKMDDEASERLFVLFYEQLLLTNNPLQALVQVQRLLIQAERPLAWWGGVQIIGRGV